MEDLRNSYKKSEIINLLESLNGYPPPITEYFDLVKTFPDTGLGYSQFNEFQLLLGYDRVSSAFFQYMVNGNLEFSPGAAFQSIDHLNEGVEEFRILALVNFGSIKIAFDELSKKDEELESWVLNSLPREKEVLFNRHKLIHPLIDILGKDTYYLGHLILGDLKKRLKNEPNNDDVQKEWDHAQEIVEKGKRNYLTYLACDHLDVYIATSMREKEEYFMVNKWVKDIFNHTKLKEMRLRWFDPTQSFCSERMDKGLFEALMLRRAVCTVYFVQENDTLGKDSELASTLAQGKPVIAYVPNGTKEYVDELIDFMSKLSPQKSEEEIILEKLQNVDPELAWYDKDVQKWLNKCSKSDIIKAKEKLVETIARVYDDRAELLRDKHPLGLQVNLTTGVANGVLVVRELSDCAKLIERIITNTMKYSLEDKIEDGKRYLLLKEELSNSVFRLVTGDEMLTNTFWNYYINQVE